MQPDSNPYSSPHVEPAQINRPKPVREGDYFVAWLLFSICATGAGAIAGVFVVATIGIIFRVAGLSQDTIRAVAEIGGFIAGLPVSYLFFRIFVTIMIVSKIM
jgi:hypothetical protein